MTKVDLHQNSWKDKDVELFWDKVASRYVKENQKVSKLHNQRFKKMVSFLERLPNLNVLNITSRDSGANDYLQKHLPSSTVINAEISQKLIDQAKKIRPYANQVKLKNYTKLPFKNQKFDLIVSLETIEHVSDPVKFLSELNRVSQPSSQLILSCPPATAEIIYKIYTHFFGGHGEGPHRFLSSKEVKTLFKKTNWQLITFKSTLIIPIGPSWINQVAESVINFLPILLLKELGLRHFYVCKKKS